jgi:hypothetical protein
VALEEQGGKSASVTKAWRVNAATCYARSLNNLIKLKKRVYGNVSYFNMLAERKADTQIDSVAKIIDLTSASNSEDAGFEDIDALTPTPTTISKDKYFFAGYVFF